MRASRTQNVALLPFLDGELFLSGQHQPLGTRSLQWHTAGWRRCYSNSRCGRWPWFSSPWSPRTTSWLLPHAAVVGGGTRFVLSPVSTTQGNIQDREAQGAWSTQLIGEGRWKRADEKKLSVWMCGVSWRAVSTGGDAGSLDTRCTVLLTKNSPCMVLRHCKCGGDHGSYWAVGLAPYPVAYRLAISHHVLPSCHLLQAALCHKPGAYHAHE